MSYWLGWNDDSLWERADDRRLHRVGESLDEIAKGLGLGAVDGVRGVFGGWPEIVGPHLAGHVQPRSLRDGTLVLAVESPAWATEVRYLQAQLLKRLAEVVGADIVRRLEVRVRNPRDAA